MLYFITLLIAFLSPLYSEEILNVSFDSTREFYNEYNKYFTALWRERTGQDVTILQSHGGSAKQARAVIDGLQADVVTLALAYDIDRIAAKGLLEKEWQSTFPHHSSPYASTVVFLVREGNPKNIRDWSDLVREEVEVITSNPKTSGGARWNYLAAMGYALETFQGDQSRALDFLSRLYGNVKILDTGSRAATITFVQREMGDVLITWENEAYLAMEKSTGQKNSIVFPSLSILAETPVAIVKKVVDRHKTRTISEFYLQKLYSPTAQQLAAKHYFRPQDPEILSLHRERFPKISLLTIAYFGGWLKAQREHFSAGGTFDRIINQNRLMQ